MEFNLHVSEWLEYNLERAYVDGAYQPHLFASECEAYLDALAYDADASWMMFTGNP